MTASRTSSPAWKRAKKDIERADGGYLLLPHLEHGPTATLDYLSQSVQVLHIRGWESFLLSGLEAGLLAA